jgi:superoxide dismutase, Fe-Mn family
MNYTLPQLPYAYNALEPVIDEQTMKIHHTKHHQTYVDKLNAALATKPDIAMIDLPTLLSDLSKVPEDIRPAVQNNGGGHINHTLFWSILMPKAPAISGEIKDAIDKTFGSFDEFKKQLSNAALNRFGSGWAWLVLSDKKLEVIATPNQDSPIMQGKIPLLGIDVWEHAYYLKYQNKRADYVEAIFKLFNWQKINEMYLASR